jgi:hypothetical protein
MKFKNIFSFLFFLLFFYSNLFAQFAGGSGTVHDPYQIQTLTQLQNIGFSINHLNKHYIQIADIDASATSGWNGGQGFEPIGDEFYSFSGSFNGNGYKITNLSINRDQMHVGLFGFVDGATISNIVLEGVNIYGNERVGGIAGYVQTGLIIGSMVEGVLNSGFGYAGGVVGLNSYGNIINTQSIIVILNGYIGIGGLAGYNSGLIENSFTEGEINGIEYVGGLVGINGGTIINSFADCEVISQNSNVSGFGGLAGLNEGVISNSFSLGNVFADEGEKIGGLVGENLAGQKDNESGIILNSYSLGNVTGFNEVGGLVGFSSHNSHIKNCFSIGLVNGNSAKGGLVGRITLSTIIESSYWDTQTSGTTQGIGSGFSSGAIGLTTLQMTNTAPFFNMTGFDFFSIWLLTENYPALFWQDFDGLDPIEPEPPLLLSPINNTELFPESISFSWEGKPFSKDFWLQIATDENFSEIFLNMEGIENSEIVVSGFPFNSEFFWRVMAGNSQGFSDWSEVWSFSTIPTFNFSVLSGNNYCSGNPVQISIELNAFHGEDNVFIVQLSDSEDNFENAIILEEFLENETFVTQVFIPETISFGTTYFIRAVATNPQAESNYFPIVFYQMPTSFFEINQEQVCGDNIVDVNYIGNASENASYYWNFDGGNIISGTGQGSYQVNWASSGQKTISLTVIENGCHSNLFSLPIQVYNPISDFFLDEMLCENSNTTIVFNGSASNSAIYFWDFDNANIVSGSGQGPYVVNWNDLGTKMISLYIEDNGCTSITTSKTIEVNPTPISTFYAPERICFNGIANIFYTGSASESASFNWFFGGGTVLSGEGPGPYEVYWPTHGIKTIRLTVEENGCSSLSTSLVRVNEATQTLPICMVTVNDSNQNVIMWNIPQTHPYHTVFIFKESAQANVYHMIGDNFNMEVNSYIDINSNPAQNSSRYKIAVLDTCGLQTQLSNFHKTMHLTINAGMNNTWNLIWDKYEGFNYSTFHIYRGSSVENMQKIAELPSNVFTYTDLTPPSGSVYYQIAVNNPNSCGFGAKSIFQINYSLSRSNLVNSQDATTIVDLGVGTFQIFPNPADDFLNIQSDFFYENIIFSLLTLDGKILFTQKITNESSTIDLSQLIKGVYIVRISYNDQLLHKKIMKM